MIHAYNEIYVDLAQQNLGSMLDYAVYDLDFNIDDFFSLFITSGIADSFGKGDCRYLSGMSGVEVANTVLEAVGLDDKITASVPRYDKTPEFWTGWVLAYYQWWSNLDFEEIRKQIKPSEIMALYHPYHEMDILAIIERLDESCRGKTRLKNRREWRGLSQSQLASLSGVPVRTIQQYEQRERDINSAKAITVESLAKALGTDSQYLLELGSFQKSKSS